MPTDAEIKSFLQDFHVKMKIGGIVVRDERGKNSQTLFDLEITKDYRDKVLESLQALDYSQGPLTEKLYGGANMWVFGKMVKGKEIYIKIAMGMHGAHVFVYHFI